MNNLIKCESYTLTCFCGLEMTSEHPDDVVKCNLCSNTVQAHKCCICKEYKSCVIFEDTDAPVCNECFEHMKVRE